MRLPFHCVRILSLAVIVAGACHTVGGQSLTRSAEYAQAETLIRDHRWDEGIDILKALLNNSPSDLKALNLMGLAFAGRGEPKKAVEFFNSALKVAPNFTPALKNLAIEEVSLGEIKAAQGHLQAASKLSPDDLVVHLYLGEIFFQKNEFPSAADHLSRARALVRRDPKVLAKLAISELKSGQQPEGLHDSETLHPEILDQRLVLGLGIELAKGNHCDRAIPYLLAMQTATPASVDAAYNLAVCYLSVKQFTQAESLLQLQIDQGRENSEVDNTLAEVYEAEHKTQKAVDAFRRAIAISPADEDNYFDFASLCLDHQDFEDAAKVLSVGLGVHPRSSRLIFERGILNAMQDHFEDAEKDFQLSADLEPESDTGYIGLGVTYLETGKAAQAIPVLRKQLNDHPDDANLNYLLAEALLRSGVEKNEPGYAEAESRLERSIRLNPNMVEPRVSLGKIYLSQDKAPEAIQQLERARTIDPKSKSACAHLAVAYRKLGQTEKAREVLLDLKELNDRERVGVVKDSVKSPDHDADRKAGPAS